ncbi:HNH endonuclease family protein [Nocardiopsis kunsanensis]|uniref:HNH endonuclease family protein n=1 Tax=Nocardiopsis kunsanensis TaxID=141693 RepID=UPI001E2AB6F9|nr:HNH endonuclease family protein [Nocardiopsis kunsanensis]
MSKKSSSRSGRSGPRRPRSRTTAALSALVAAVAVAVVALQQAGVVDLGDLPAGPSPGATPSDASEGRAQEQLEELRIEDEAEPAEYDRALFPHWDHGVEDNCTSRQVVLERDGEDVEVDDDCQPVSGRWDSRYDDEVLTDAQEIDIDHMVPLKEGWRSGAHAWTTEERRGFANDLDSSQLWAVSASSNRSKGDSDPSDWMPPSEKVHCDYVASWIEVKHTWDLTVDPDEEQALREVLEAC